MIILFDERNREVTTFTRKKIEVMLCALLEVWILRTPRCFVDMKIYIDKTPSSPCTIFHNTTNAGLSTTYCLAKAVMSALKPDSAHFRYAVVYEETAS